MQHMSTAALEVTELTKDYDGFRAVDNISFSIPNGAVIGLLGPNGAGKTTTIQMLMGTTLPTSGSIKYFGQDFAKHRQACLQRINYTSAYSELQSRITVKENLLVFAGLYSVKKPMNKIQELAEYLEITELLNQRFRTLSAGQKTRVNIAKALINDPELLMMDEPTASLDPDIRDKVMSLIEALRKTHNKSILFTSHNMDEVTRICDEVIFLDHGQILRQSTPQKMAEEVDRPQLHISFRGSLDVVKAQLAKLADEIRVESDDHVSIVIDTAHIPAAIASLDNLADITVTDIDIRKPTLEDAFLLFTRAGAREGEGVQ